MKMNIYINNKLQGSGLSLEEVTDRLRDLRDFYGLRLASIERVSPMVCNYLLVTECNRINLLTVEVYG